MNTMGEEWHKCVKKQIVVEYREVRPGEKGVKTREGFMSIPPGDYYIMRGVEQELYFIEKGIFRKTYNLLLESGLRPFWFACKACKVAGAVVYNSICPKCGRKMEKITEKEHYNYQILPAEPISKTYVCFRCGATWEESRYVIHEPLCEKCRETEIDELRSRERPTTEGQEPPAPGC